MGDTTCDAAFDMTGDAMDDVSFVMNSLLYSNSF